MCTACALHAPCTRPARALHAAQVLFVDSMSGSPHGFVATVIFRSKEARSQAPHHSASAHHTAAANSAAAAEASADARAAVHAVTDADAGADAAADAGVVDAEYVERRQAWHGAVNGAFMVQCMVQCVAQCMAQYMGPVGAWWGRDPIHNGTHHVPCTM